MAGPQRQFSAHPQSVALDLLGPPSLPTRRENIDGDRIYRLHGLLRPTECRAWIQAAQALGFAPAGLAIGEDRFRVNEHARNNERVMIEDEALARGLWTRMQAWVTPRHEGEPVRGLNWRFRIYRYEPGQYFRPHRDLRMDLPGGGQTRYSLMIFLNEEFEGGRTRFFGRGAKGKNPVTHAVVPTLGSAVVFDHLLLHEGEQVTAGVKYAVRTDLIYG